MAVCKAVKRAMKKLGNKSDKSRLKKKTLCKQGTFSWAKWNLWASQPGTTAISISGISCFENWTQGYWEQVVFPWQPPVFTILFCSIHRGHSEEFSRCLLPFFFSRCSFPFLHFQKLVEQKSLGLNQLMGNKHGRRPSETWREICTDVRFSSEARRGKQYVSFSRVMDINIAVS